MTTTLLIYLCAIFGSLNVGILIGYRIAEKNFHKSYTYYQSLREAMDKAIEREDYETAGKIQKKLKRYL